MNQTYQKTTIAGFIDKIGYRTSAILAHAFVAVGLFSLTILPDCRHITLLQKKKAEI